MTPAELTADYDWKEVFKYAAAPTNPLTREKCGGYRIEAVRRVIATTPGENDGAEWVGLFEMDDGKYLAIRAGCDYTGWGCQEGGSSEVTATEAEAIACLSAEERTRLLPEAQS